MTGDLLCERCWNVIDRSREPFRMARCGTAGARTFVHAMPCLTPDTGEWDPIRRGVSPAAIRHAASQADHR